MNAWMNESRKRKRTSHSAFFGKKKENVLATAGAGHFGTAPLGVDPLFAPRALLALRPAHRQEGSEMSVERVYTSRSVRYGGNARALRLGPDAHTKSITKPLSVLR